MDNEIAQVTSDNFKEEVLESDIPVLVDFWAPWCGPCQMIGHMLEELANENQGKVKLVKVNMDEAPEIANNYGIQSIPTLIFFHQGEPKERIIGVRPKEKLQDFIAKNS